MNRNSRLLIRPQNTSSTISRSLGSPGGGKSAISWLRSASVGIARQAGQVDLVDQGRGRHPFAAQLEQLVEAVAGRLQLLVQGGAVGEVQHLDHRRLVGPLAFADDPPRVAAEGLEEVILDRRVVELHGPRAQRIEVGLLHVAAGEGDRVELGRHLVTCTIASCSTSAIIRLG